MEQQAMLELQILCMLGELIPATMEVITITTIIIMMEGATIIIMTEEATITEAMEVMTTEVVDAAEVTTVAVAAMVAAMVAAEAAAEEAAAVVAAEVEEEIDHMTKTLFPQKIKISIIL